MTCTITQEELVDLIDTYIEEHWEDVLGDIKRLVVIDSTDDTEHAQEGAPYGPGPKAALDEALSIASGMGFETRDCEGYVGYADFQGASNTQIGMIGHVDVVPAGTGWTYPVFDVSCVDGILIGRGTIDDKGPSVVALHAMKILKDTGITWPYTLRMIFGTNEEVGMADLEYFLKNYPEPAFTFTPDAEFPVGYGEKGGYDGLFTSEALVEGRLLELEGGVAGNAVPSTARALVCAEGVDVESLAHADYIKLSVTDAGIQVEAEGIGGHASKPQNTRNAIAVLIDYLLKNNLCSTQERRFFEMVLPLLQDYTGALVGIDCADEHFGPLTIIGGTIKLEDARIAQSIDIRYPTSISDKKLTQIFSERACAVGADFEVPLLMKPFLVDPQSGMIQALLSAYQEVTGDDSQPFTMGGGTYARHFKSAASFGPVYPHDTLPEWVGPEHGANEGVAEETLKRALKIYTLTLYKLMHLDL